MEREKDAVKKVDTAAGAGQVRQITVLEHINEEIDRKIRQLTKLVNLRDIALERGLAHMPQRDIAELAWPDHDYGF
jgi:hypothetical protein